MSEHDDEHDDIVDTEATVLCPYCGELNDIALDPGGGGRCPRPLGMTP